MPTAPKPIAKVQLAGMSDAAVKAKTGCTWQRWFDALEKEGARRLDHQAITALVAKISPKLSGWWVQMVTVGYERMAGKRVRHETTAGFQVSASKTLTTPIGKVHEWWTDAKKAKRWLPGEEFRVTRFTPGKSVRVAWGDGDERVEVNLYAKGKGKVQMALQHNRLKSAAAAKKKQQWWRARLAELERVIGEG